MDSHDNQQVIALVSISKAFGLEPVLDNIDLAVRKSQSLCVCGINGVGKSTLLRIIAGLLRPDEGSVDICGYDIDTQGEKARGSIGFISHKSMLYLDLTVAENLLFFARLYGIGKPKERVNQLIEDIGLVRYKYDKASILSRGMLQRLAIARAIIHNPAILLADEPFTGLDAHASQQLVNLLSVLKARGHTLLMATHNTSLALQCCDRIAVLEKGRFILDAKTTEIDTEAFIKDYSVYAWSHN